MLSTVRRTLQSAPELYLLGTGLLLCIAIFKRDFYGISGFTYLKEFVLVLTALLAGVATALRARALRVDAIDAALIAFLVWSCLSLTSAVNSWWAVRSVLVLGAGTGIFWISRSLRERGLGLPLGLAIAVALAATAAPALLEAYGILPDLSVGYRSPAGTLGNRNSVANLLMLGLPLVLVGSLAVPSRAHATALHLLVACAAAALLLSRTRTAWLAALVMGVTLVLGLYAMPRPVRVAIPVRRLRWSAAAAAAGLLAAWQLPNSLVWTSPSPYAESLQGMVNYQSGSGRGRLVQYATTLRMIGHHPLLGVGPGNWKVRYPEFASPGDPTLKTEFVTTRLHNGSWLAFAAELGIPALLFLVLALWGLLRVAWRGLRGSAGPGRALEGLALLVTLAVMAVLGLFDSKLHTPAGMFLWFTILGALAPRELPETRVTLSGAARLLWPPLVAIALFGGVIQTGRQLYSAWVSRSGTTADLTRALKINPGDYGARMQLVRTMASRGRCDLAARHFAVARGLYPSATPPDPLLARCPAHAASAGF